MYEMANEPIILDRKERLDLQSQIENLEKIKKDLEDKLYYEINSRDKHISSIEKELNEEKIVHYNAYQEIEINRKKLLKENEHLNRQIITHKDELD